MINNIKVCCVQKVIPLAFDESLSYLEMLCAMLKKVNETITEVNRLSDIVNNIDVNFDEINEKVDFHKWIFGHHHDDMMIYDKHVLLYHQIVQIA